MSFKKTRNNSKIKYMKGVLLNKDQKWIVQYEEVDNTSFGIAAATGGAIIPSVKELPLHPDDAQLNPPSNGFIKHVNVTGEPIEVEFEIVPTFDWINGRPSNIIKYAKLIHTKEEKHSMQDFYEYGQSLGIKLNDLQRLVSLLPKPKVKITEVDKDLGIIDELIGKKQDGAFDEDGFAITVRGLMKAG